MSVCSIAGCGGKVHGHGLCRRHLYAVTSEQRKLWRMANPDKVKAMKARYHVRHAKQIMAKVAKWVRDNPERRRANVRKWDKANAPVCVARHAKRRAKKLNATPAWANIFFIQEAYDLARRRTVSTGFKWHVDHIVPLQSKVVCGLHVEHNIQVTPAIVNRVKSNRTWPDMP